MKKILSKLIIFGLLFPLYVACSTEDADMGLNSLNSAGTIVQAEVITANQLVGIWKIASMSSVQTTVDFDQNGVRTNDLLKETDCFDTMYFDFKESGAVATRQARLYFSTSTGQFSCQTTGDYAATYEVSGNELTVTFIVDGQQYTDTKTISLFSENGNEFLKVTLIKEETNSAVYVANDPGNTVASGIQEIEIIYIKQ